MRISTRWQMVGERWNRNIKGRNRLLFMIGCFHKYYEKAESGKSNCVMSEKVF